MFLWYHLLNCRRIRVKSREWQGVIVTWGGHGSSSDSTWAWASCPFMWSIHIGVYVITRTSAVYNLSHHRESEWRIAWCHCSVGKRCVLLGGLCCAPGGGSRIVPTSLSGCRSHLSPLFPSLSSYICFSSSHLVSFYPIQPPLPFSFHSLLSLFLSLSSHNGDIFSTNTSTANLITVHVCRPTLRKMWGWHIS